MAQREPSGAAVGWIMFAGVVMVISGGFSMLQGLAMLVNDDKFGGSDILFEQDATAWGWVHLLVGLVVFLAGIGVYSGNVFARTIGVLAALASLFATFLSASIAPLWAIFIIAVDLSVVWALTAHGRDYAEMKEMTRPAGSQL